MGEQRLEVDAGGRPVLAKVAAAGPEADRLRHEAEVLHAAAHPGVAQLLGSEEQGDGGYELRLAVAGTRTFAEVRADLAGGVRVLASLATTLADLHDLGIVHGRVSADHVVIDAAGRPVLCGFAEAGRRGALDPAADVLGLGRLLASLLHGAGAAGGDWEPIPERRFAPGDRWTGFARRALLTLADHATAEDPGRRPSARAFAAAVLTALPPPTDERPARHRAVLAAVRARVADRSRRVPPGGAGPGDAPVLDAVAMLEAEEPAPDPTPRRPVLPGRGWVAPLAGAVGLGLLVFGVGALLRPAGPAPTAASPPAPTTSAASTGDPAIATTATTAPAGACAPVPEPSADPDGDGCPSSVRVGDAEVEVDGVRYGVGRPGDLLAVGDWDCDGSATVALVRPGTGEVFVFDGWGSAGVEVTVASTGTVPGARSLAPTEHPDGCDALVVVDDTGRRTEVPA